MVTVAIMGASAAGCYFDACRRVPGTTLCGSGARVVRDVKPESTKERNRGS